MRESRSLALVALLFVSAAMGQTAPQSEPEDISSVRKAAEQGNKGSQAELAFDYMLGLHGVKQDDAEAAKWYKRAAEQGVIAAQVTLAGFYERGRGVLQDYAEAVRWYRAAAEQGNEGAQTDLAAMYEKGKGVPQDYAEAVHWYRGAAEKGYPAAQLGLGLMYSRGDGVTQDYVEAHMWLNLFASQMYGPFVGADGQRLAASFRDDVASKMTAEQIAEAQRLAREWKPTKAK